MTTHRRTFPFWVIAITSMVALVASMLSPMTSGILTVTIVAQCITSFALAVMLIRQIHNTNTKPCALDLTLNPTNYEYLIGREVIHVTNEGTYRTGTLKHLPNQDEYKMPVIETDEKELFLCGGLLLPYSNEMLAWISSMKPEVVWATLAPMHTFIQDMGAMYRQSVRLGS